jgi:hypothetical protein
MADVHPWPMMLRIRTAELLIFDSQPLMMNMPTAIPTYLLRTYLFRTYLEVNESK